MSDMSPSPPLNRRKTTHRRSAAATGGDSHHNNGRNRDHPQSRLHSRQHHHHHHGQAQSNQQSSFPSTSGRQQPNRFVECAGASSTSSFVGLNEASASSGGSIAVGGSKSNLNNLAVGDSKDDECSDNEEEVSANAVGANSPDVCDITGGQIHGRRNKRTRHVSGDLLLSNDDEDDEENEINDDCDDLGADFAEDRDSVAEDERMASVVNKRPNADADGVDYMADRFQQVTLGVVGAGASVMLHPLHNAAAVARSHAVGVPHNPLHNWQATKHTLKERFSFMFCNEILADVHFVVGRGDQRQRIPAHRFVLSVGSAVFDAMFNGAMAQNHMEDIDLPDVEVAAFLALLKFLYSDDVQIGPESVMTTLYTAKKYAVPALENACVEFLKRALNADNAFMLLTQARLFDEPHLAALCLEVIDKHTNEALNAEGFTDIDMDTLCAVLERDSLRVREVGLYQAVVRWGTEECRRRNLSITPENQRSVLGRALQLIRFPLMTVEEFAQTAAQSGILSDREAVNLFLYFTVNPKPSVGFLDIPRCCVTGKEQVVNRFQRIEGRWGYSGTPDRIKFNVDRRIYVVGFGLYGSIHGPVEYQVTIQIIHCGTGKVVGSNETTFQCDGSANTFRVLFKEPVEISSSVTYIASACLKGPDSHYGTKGLRRVVQQTANSGCVTFQFTYAAGNNNGTSVEDGQIPEIIYYTKLCA